MFAKIRKLSIDIVNPEIFAKSVKRHICEVNYSRLGHDVLISVNDRVISPFHEDSFLMKLRNAKFGENKTLAKISDFTGTTCMMD